MSVEAIKKNLKRKQDFINDIVVIDNFPLFNWIELNINEVCNRRCVFCPRSQGYPQENIHMEVSQAEFIASEVKNLEE
jgi:hydrogenase maturation factor HypF (carbamoyltransferase family)